MKKYFFVFCGIILVTFLVFKLGRFHFSSNYIIGRNISSFNMKKLDQDWKSCGGKSLQGYDFLDLTDGRGLVVDDTLYLDGRPVAEIVSLVHRAFIDYELTVKSIPDGEIGYYCSK